MAEGEGELDREVEGDAAERRLKDRLKRRRARRESAADEVAPDVSYDFGYGGWTVTLDKVEMPEAERQVAVPKSNAQKLKAKLKAGAAKSAARPAKQPPADPPAEEEPPKPLTEAMDEAALDDHREDARAAAAAERRAMVRAAAARRTPDAPSAGGRPLIAPPRDNRRAPQPAELRADPESPAGRRAAGRRERRVEVGPAEEAKTRARRDEAGAKKRRHQRIEGGGTVMIGNDLFPLLDWSMGGIAISSDLQLFRIGDQKSLELELDMGDYAVNLDLDAEVVNRSADRTGLKFLAPTERQRQLLRALSHAAIHGKGFSAPFEGKGRATIPGQAAKRSNKRLWRALSPVAAIASFPFNAAVIALIVSVALLTLRGGELPQNPIAGTDRTPAIRADHAMVAVERLPLTAEADGTLLEWGIAPGDAVGEGVPLVSVGLGDEDGTRATLNSPCDCTVARIVASENTAIAAGDTVAVLTPREAPVHIQALFAPGAAPQAGNRVSIEMPSGDRYEGVVERVGVLEDPQAYIGLPTAIVRGNDTVFARIRTTTALPAELAGNPAIVTLQPEA
ncbi:MAG: PilZ domain-containing protein [Pseudomonadota bacterium]